MSRRIIHPIASPYLQGLLEQKAKEHALFTVCELRDQLAELKALADFDQKTLRLYVRDQINKRVKQGIVEWVGLQKGFKNRYVFRLIATSDLNADNIYQDTPQASSDVEPLAVKLSRDSQQLRAQIETSDYRLQAFQEIAEKYPDARDEIGPLFEHEKAQAKALDEKLKAYADVQRKLAQAGGEA
ncbi:hypothetical protein M0220_13990 [Halomonas qinghailakensis]|uniref:Uncharacterized protein n=1 Tax=Halomonas qinghailakensis TaxID=2937790 RepID=A0AA46YPT3_9GAMM|nr:hypothetical protein [Halomonas sp. ZZQ-149]UYO73973.1 hypothetical protein M0220_13990 [Halomonas sp. ZZQ-149]